MSNKINILLNAILSKDSAENINKQIETLQTQLNEIKLDGQLAKQLEALEKIDLSNLTVNTGKAEKEIEKTVDGLNKIKDKQKEISDQQIKIGFLFGDKEIKRDFEDLKKHVEDTGGKLKWEIDTTDGRNEITKLSAVYENFGKTTEKVFNKVQTTDGYLVWDVTKLKEVDSVVRDTAKAFTQVDTALKNSVDAGSITVKQFNQMSEGLQRVKDNKDGISEISRELSKMNESSKYVDKLNNQMRELASQGKLSAKDMQHFNETINQSGNINKKTYEELSFSIKQVGRENKLVEKEMQAELRERERLLKRVEELQTMMIRTQQRQPKVQKDSLYGGTIDALNNMNINKHTMDLASLEKQVTQTSQSINRMAANATEAGRTQIGIVDSFKIALEKFPVWMATTTVFYGTIRSAKEFMSIIIDIDTKMTDLRKVMADGTDFSGVFDDATESAKQFGQTISDTMDAYIEFARQGFDGNQLKDLSDAALVFSNVSELGTADAAGHLTATIVQYNKEASEAMRITDNWNEIGNSFATTSSAVAEGVNKSASVAKAMGMELEELNAMVAQLTASTKQSGAEIGNMIKSVLPRLTSKPAKAALESVGVSLTDAEGNLRNVVEIYREVGIAIQDMDGLQKASIAEGLGG